MPTTSSGTANHTASIAACIASAAAIAMPFEITSHTIDAGGGVIASGRYQVSGTIGQHDAAPPSTTGVYQLTGGFWSGIDAGCNSADGAPPFGQLDLADITSFVSSFIATLPSADLDGNGIYDLTDLTTFIAAFTAGCP